MFRKTALLGAAMMLPVMSNIVMINLFFRIAWGAMGTSVFIFASMLAVLWQSRRALVGVFWTDQADEPASVRRNGGDAWAVDHHLDGIGLMASAPANRRIPHALWCG